MRIRWWILLLVMFLVVGCGNKTFDGSSQEAAKASMEAMCDDMTREEAIEFRDAYLKIGIKMTFAGKSVTDVLKAMDGKTAKEIIEDAKKLDK